MESQAFRQWALVEGCLAPSTVDETAKRLAYLERRGLDLGVFGGGVEGARGEGRRILSEIAVAGRGHAYRNACKALNLYAMFLASRDPAFRDDKGKPVVRWDLPPSPRSQHKRFTDAEVQALLHYRQGSRTKVSKRRRALLWICWATGLRRGEIADIRVSDLNQERGVLFVGKPRKEGKRREVPLPDDAWSPNRPLQAWLRIRPQETDSLWCGATPHDLGSQELRKIGREVGFRVSFTRFRHYRGKTLGKSGVPIQVIQEAMGHATPNTTRIYVEELTAEEMADAFQRAGVPGFKSRDRTRSHPETSGLDRKFLASP